MFVVAGGDQGGELAVAAGLQGGHVKVDLKRALK